MPMRILRVLLLAIAAFAVAGLAVAQSEPTVQQIYEVAKSGQVEKARQMTQEVLRSHPKSAKAHFVMAELDASQGNVARAREELLQAETLAPGLPFAKPEALQALRSRIESSAATASTNFRIAPAAAPARDAPAAPSFPWGTVLLGALLVAVVASVIRSRAARRAAGPVPDGSYGASATGTGWGMQGPGSGPQPGGGPSPQQGYGPQPGYGAQNGYGPQPGVGPQPAQPGMGGRLMGGLATGLAVGAGALAAQEIGRRMMGDTSQHGPAPGTDAHSASASHSQLANDAGLGSVGGGGGASLPDDFGIADGSSWDAGGSFDGGGGDGGSWDT